MPLKKIEQNVHKEYHTWELKNISEIFSKVDPDEFKFPNFPVQKTYNFSTEVQGHAVDWYVTLKFFNNELRGGFLILFDAVKELEPKNHVTCNFYLVDADKNKFFLGRKNRKFDSTDLYGPEMNSSNFYGSDLPNTIDKLLPNDIMTLGIELITYLDDDPIFPFECIDCTYKLDPNLSDDFLELYKFQDDGDVMICVQDIKFPVYKKVLKARCSKLYEMVDHHQQMSDGNDNQVALTDIKPEIFKRVLEYIYTGKVEDLDDHAENLLEAASNYKLTGLKNLCEDSIINYYYTEENSEQVKSLAVNCGAINLMRNVLGIKATTGGIAVYENFYRSGILERMEMLAN